MNGYRRHPTCFVSYCWESVDRLSVEMFHAELERIAPPQFKVLIDVKSVGPGESIPDHEKNIQTCDIAVLLLTPSYASRVRNRTDCGTYREFKILLSRIESYRDQLQAGGSASPFHFIPVLFSGTPEESVPNELKDYRYLDFRGFRGLTTQRGKSFVSDSIMRAHEAEFKSIEGKFDSCLAHRKKKFYEKYKKWQQILFLDTKNESTVRLAKRYHGESERELIEKIFVKTAAFKRIRAQDKCILIGRKGSGKSTIVDSFHQIKSDEYKPPIDVHVDSFHLEFIYKFISQTHASEIGDVISFVDYFHVVWLLFLYFECAKTIESEETQGANVVSMKDYLPDLQFLSLVRELDHWPQFVRVCEQVKEAISKAISETESDKTYYPKVATKVGRDALIKTIFGMKEVSVFEKMILKCRRRFIFALDGFDLRFEEFRNSYTILKSGEAEKERKSLFERGWLTGLLRAVLDVRGGDSLLSDKMDFCVTIPQDRYLEARGFERDDYRYRDLAAEIRWTAYELAILLWKRLECLIDYKSSRKNNPLERLEEVLENEEYSFPEVIQVNSGKNTVSISLFKYMLRHTFWRPRDMLFLFAALLTTNDMLTKVGQKMTSDIIKEIVSRTTYDIIYSEFVREYEANITNIQDVIRAFEGAPLVMTYDETHEKVKNVSLAVNGGATRISDNATIIDTLFALGFLGLIVSDRLKRQNLRGSEYFSFADGDRHYLHMDSDQKRRERYCIHPLFCEYLSLDTDVGRILCVYSDEYLALNDRLATL